MENKRSETDRCMTRGIRLTLSLLFCLFAMGSTLEAHAAQGPNATLPTPKRRVREPKPPPPTTTAPVAKPTPAIPKPSSTPAASSSDTVRDPCSPQAKEDLYASFRQHYRTEQAKAYDEARNYLRCPSGAVTPAQQQIIDFLKKFSAAYEAADRKIRLRDLLYNQKKYPEAYALGREILTDEPDNLKVLVDLGANGYMVMNDSSVKAPALSYARRALQQLDSGRSLDDWDPIGSREVALAYLNYTIGSGTLETDPDTAVRHLLKSVQFDTALKNSAITYALIAGAYETGDYAKRAAEYKRLYTNKDETPESKLALANINQIVDRMIDGYARAIALAGNDAKYVNSIAGWRESLTTWYKFRNNDSTAGMTELIGRILSKRIPPLPTPITLGP